MAMQADTMDNTSSMRVKGTVFQARQSDVPCNKIVSIEFTLPQKLLLTSSLANSCW